MVTEKKWFTDLWTIGLLNNSSFNTEDLKTVILSCQPASYLPGHLFLGNLYKDNVSGRLVTLTKGGVAKVLHVSFT